MDQDRTSTFPYFTTRQVVYATFSVVAVVVAFWILYRFSWVLVVLFIAFVLGTAIRPPVNWLSQHSLKRAAAVLLVYLALLILLVSFIALTAPLIAEQSAQISRSLSHYYGVLRNTLAQSPSIIFRQVAARLPIDLTLLTQAAPSGGDLVDQVSGFLLSLGLISRGILFLVAVFLLGFYWTLEGERILLGFTLWLPTRRREDIRELIDQIENRVGSFIIGQSILCLAIGLMALVAYTLIGLPNVLSLAIIAGVFEAVPIVGPVIGAVPAFIIALSLDPSKAIWVILSTIIIQALENNLLVPRVMKRSVGINPIITLLALATFASLLGLPGALLAVPMAAIIQLLLERYLLTPGDVESQVPLSRDQLGVFRYEAREIADDLRGYLRQGEDQSSQQMERLEDEIESVVGDLDRLLLVISGEEDAS